MKYTLAQFKTIESDGIIHLDDTPLNLTPEESLRLFNALPSHIQGDAVSWGISGDTCTRDAVFVWVLDNVYGMSSDEWYANFDENYNNPDFSKLPEDL